MPNIEPFQRYADAYDRWFEDHRDLLRAELAVVRELIPSPGAVGMEVGVGSGQFAEPLGIRIGVEPSERMADRARERGISVHSGVAEALPFPGGRFDYVLMVTTICFVDDVALSFGEAYRVLKAGGFIIVGFVDRESRLGRRYVERKERSRFYGDARFYSTPEVLEYLEASGFGITRVLQTLTSGEEGHAILDGFGEGSFVAVQGRKTQSEPGGAGLGGRQRLLL